MSSSGHKIKVLHFMSHGFVGGQEKALYQLFKAFQNDEDFQFGVAIGGNEGFYMKKIEELDIPLINTGLKSGFALKLSKNALRELRSYQIHHFHDPSPNQIIASLFAGRDIIRVFTRRGGPIDYRRYGLKKILRYYVNKIMLRNFFQGFSGNTRNATTFVKEYYGITDKKVQVLYNGIDFKLLSPSIDKSTVLRELNLDTRAFKIGTACHLLNWKRVDLLIRAFSICKIENRKLLIFGRGPELPNLKSLVKSLNLESRVIFAGEVTNMPDYMQILDCFVLASGKEESFGNAVVEAMYLKVPSIIMNDSDGLREHIIDNDTGFIAREEKDLARKIEFIANNSASARKIAENASEYVFHKYSLANMKKAYKSFYWETLGNLNRQGAQS